jgi:hypothetical protein
MNCTDSTQAVFDKDEALERSKGRTMSSPPKYSQQCVLCPPSHSTLGIGPRLFSISLLNKEDVSAPAEPEVRIPLFSRLIYLCQQLRLSRVTHCSSLLESDTRLAKELPPLCWRQWYSLPPSALTNYRLLPTLQRSYSEVPLLPHISLTAI